MDAFMSGVLGAWTGGFRVSLVKIMWYPLSVGALASHNSSQLKWEGVLVQLN